MSGTAASITSTIALALVAWAEGNTASQLINARSHWLNGNEAGSFKGVDIAYTAVGYVNLGGDFVGPFSSNGGSESDALY